MNDMVNCYVSWGGNRVVLRDRLTIGRSSRCDLVFEGDRGMSRIHAAITVCAYGAVVEDLHSKNGLWIDDELVRGSRLLIGSHTLRVGSTLLELLVSNDETRRLKPLHDELTWNGTPTAVRARRSATPPGWMGDRESSTSRTIPDGRAASAFDEAPSSSSGRAMV